MIMHFGNRKEIKYPRMNLEVLVKTEKDKMLANAIIYQSAQTDGNNPEQKYV